MKDKWLRFFRVGISKIQYNTDRVLKNTINESVIEYISDELYNFNDS